MIPKTYLWQLSIQLMSDCTFPCASQLMNWVDNVTKTIINKTILFRSSFGSSPAPRAPPPTPALGRPVTPQQSHHLQQQNMSKFLDNNFFATHLKTLSEHFSKNGGGGNGFLESLPFKAFMNDEIHQVNY